MLKMDILLLNHIPLQVNPTIQLLTTHQKVISDPSTTTQLQVRHSRIILMQSINNTFELILDSTSIRAGR